MNFKEFLNENNQRLSKGDVIKVIKKSPILDRLAMIFYGKQNDAYNIRPGFKFTVTGVKGGMYSVVTSDSNKDGQVLSKQDVNNMLAKKLIQIFDDGGNLK